MRYAMMMTAPLLLAAGQPALTPPSETVATVTMTNFRFAPATLRLVAGQRYALRFVNDAHGGHSFASKPFFAAAMIDSASRSRAMRGTVEVPGGSSVTIHLTAPARGRYPLKCTHFLHGTMGMTGEVVVS